VNAPVIAVDPDAEIPPYQQIVENVKAAIQRNELPPNALLPTVRQLADDLNVAPNTVARAYGDLAVEGWIVSEGRRGTRIAPRVPTSDKRVRARVLRETLERVVTSLLARGYSPDEISAETRSVLET
jgi:GntR family transcriptional regulator